MNAAGQPKRCSARLYEQYEEVLRVSVANEQTSARIDTERVERLATYVLLREGIARLSELSITFVGIDEMADLNLRHMGYEGPTDVLAFPIDGVTLDEVEQADAPTLLGDVVICASVAAENAQGNINSYPGHEGSLSDEIDLLVVHGVLHVLGRDHAEEQERIEMQKVERSYLAAFREEQN